ncbi:MAG: hypothetical protein HYZ43_12975 [Flavobacteriia bacterium]|nr:hypothetical protein [Flavobacteriia bacterium]
MKNRLEVTDIESGKTLVREATIPFSNERLLIAENIPAERFGKELISELLLHNKKFFNRPVRMVLQPVDPEITEITAVERMIYHDFAFHSGARYIWLCDHQRPMSSEEVLDFIKQSRS